jgi:hypothetical protein
MSEGICGYSIPQINRKTIGSAYELDIRAVCIPGSKVSNVSSELRFLLLFALSTLPFLYFSIFCGHNITLANMTKVH